MARQTTTYDLLVSCPGDVVDKGYLSAVENSVAQFNSTFGKFNNVNLQVVHWSKDSYPESGGRAQALLDSQIVDGSDAAVALLFTRFGTPTDKYGSGTEEEIERMLHSHKQVFMYFINEPIKMSEVDSMQYQRVQDFKTRYSTLEKGMYGEVESPEELQGELLNHLSLHFLTRIVKSDQTDDVQPVIEIIDSNNSNKFKLESLVQGTDVFLQQRNDKIIKRIKELNESVIKGRVLNEDTNNRYVPNEMLRVAAMKIPEYDQRSRVKFDDDDVSLLKSFAERNSVELNNDFFSLGDLTQSIRPIILGLSNDLNGTAEEKARYNAVLEICDEIKKVQQFQEYFGKLGQFHSLSLAVTNTGRAFDEDLDITLRVPRGSLVRPADLPVPGKFIISEFKGYDAVEYLFGLAATASIERYNSGYVNDATLPNLSLSVPMLQRSQEEVYQHNREEYQSNVNSLFDYEYFSESNSELVRFHVDYLKQHRSMWFPTVLIFSNRLEEINYSITSKHLPDKVSGSFKIEADGQA